MPTRIAKIVLSNLLHKYYTKSNIESSLQHLEIYIQSKEAQCRLKVSWFSIIW